LHAFLPLANPSKERTQCDCGSQWQLREQNAAGEAAPARVVVADGDGPVRAGILTNPVYVRTSCFRQDSKTN
jgi:hypothetical protein